MPASVLLDGLWTAFIFFERALAELILLFFMTIVLVVFFLSIFIVHFFITLFLVAIFVLNLGLNLFCFLVRLLLRVS